MKRSDSYNTRQKDLIISIIKKQKQPFTIKDIYQELDTNVGLTTIYRLVDKMVINNRLNKFITKNNITYYQYLDECDKDNHFYLRCDECGTLSHVDCDCINELTNHLFNEHSFKPNKENIIIDGLCHKCINKNNKEVKA